MAWHGCGDEYALLQSVLDLGTVGEGCGSVSYCLCVLCFATLAFVQRCL